MDQFTCTQRGCPIDADEHPDTCPTCNNPQNFDAGNDNGNGEAPWSDYSITELREYAESWELSEYFDSRTTKPGLITILEAAEAAQE